MDVGERAWRRAAAARARDGWDLVIGIKLAAGGPVEEERLPSHFWDVPRVRIFCFSSISIVAISIASSEEWQELGN